jgi:DNA-binding NarL/FixJ family response regulator
LVLCVEAVQRDVFRRLRDLPTATPTRTVLIARTVRHEDALPLVECGVIAVLPRDHTTPQQLTRVVLGAPAGRSTFPSDLLGSLMTQIVELQPRTGSRALTPLGLNERECAVLRLLADGCTTAEIAERTSYSERTVKNILYTALSTLRARSRSQAVATAVRAGLI